MNLFILYQIIDDLMYKNVASSLNDDLTPVSQV